ncbi:helix-turn-helix domain-containing protein [Antrihabitans sp. YC3-6]|uniref:Helix-turn-helix domain-containing protein n=1 Tax=Antrihabitans stalagmiti TaxID=2799499 RepID=A0A934NV31_9NOCA|nr:helix-turn-helix domain-containing protein [Antrihabitans stalagmiti]MBJ8341961.1 helix-turn-helix domain-containing protein [Antrihabitans stalagmiti]
MTDTELSAETIAAAHNISVRYLYKITANAEFTLAQWITNQRLLAARAELANPTSAYRSVAMIARTWGFTNPAHFSRRFRDAFGSTPREWRTLALGDRASDTNDL